MEKNKHKLQLPKITYCLAVLMMCLSCSVKEDRAECPCSVSVVTQALGDCVVSFYASDRSLIERKVISAADLLSGENHTYVPKGDIYVSVLDGMEHMSLVNGYSIVCRSGIDADRVYGFSRRDAATGDTLLVTGVLQKQHSVITLILRNAPGEEYPYDIRVVTPCNALDLVSFAGDGDAMAYEPAVVHAGVSAKSQESRDDWSATFVVTRQDDDKPLLLHFLDRVSGAVSSTLDLGHFIALTGYSWSAEYLGDITVVLDRVKMTLTVEVADWNRVITAKYEI